MSHPKRHKKPIKSDIPEVKEFASYLDELIKERTSEHQLVKAAKVGNDKLTMYLNGMRVPHPRVLQHYIIGPLEREFLPLDDSQRVKLTRLHQQACRAQPMHNPSPEDQVLFLKEDIALLEKRLEEVTEQLNAARDKNAAASDQMAQMGLREEDLLAQIGVWTAQVKSLQHALEKSRKEYQTALRGEGQQLAEFAEEKRRELVTYQQKIAELEAAVSGSADLSKHVDLLEGQVRALNQENASLRKKNIDDGKLFTELVRHVAKGGAIERELTRMSRRLEQSEQTIAQLTTSTKTLTETNKALTEEVDRLTQAAEFLRVSATLDDPLGIPLREPAPPLATPAPIGRDPLMAGGPDPNRLPTVDELQRISSDRAQADRNARAGGAPPWSGEPGRPASAQVEAERDEIRRRAEETGHPAVMSGTNAPTELPAVPLGRSRDEMADDDYWATIMSDKPKFPWQHDSIAENER